jgi:RimJ/RimL family protein N-acetyltransferase
MTAHYQDPALEPQNKPFALLYLRTTEAMRDANTAGEFSDPVFWDTVVIPTFANYYLDAYAARIASANAQLNWVVHLRVDDQAIGMLQAIFADGGHAAEIAWVIGVPWQGQRLATEATRAVVAWLDARGVQTITAWIRPDHHASAAVALRAGLTSTGKYRDTKLHREQHWRRRLQNPSAT